jgi:hypothetical protein
VIAKLGHGQLDNGHFGVFWQRVFQFRERVIGLFAYRRLQLAELALQRRRLPAILLVRRDLPGLTLSPFEAIDRGSTSRVLRRLLGKRQSGTAIL